mmetsp:Transcript_37061/g.97588  ORF Transcript_37061/g.97588 Transcript_37061/m.97588 type:complete len:512 (-) Transcript_37061:157-1692(-)
MLPTQAMSPCGAIRTDFAKSFRIIEDMPLGEGLTAEVWRAHELRNDRASSDDSSCGGMDRQLGKRQVAAKIFKQDAASDEPSYVSMPAALQREADLLAAVQGHPNVLRFHSVFWLSGDEVPQKGSEATLVSPRWCLTTELCGGTDLYSTLRIGGSMQEHDAKPIMLGILRALAHIHKRGILHRDVKVENVMLREDGCPVLADFGLSCRMSDEQAMLYRCGSPGYIPPEVLLKRGWREQSDTFGAGVMLFVMFSLQRPFLGHDVVETLKKTIRCRLSFSRHSRFETVTPECKALIRRLLSKDPEDRLLAEEALQETWFSGDDAMACPNCVGESDARPSHASSHEPAMPKTTDDVSSSAPSGLLSLIHCHEAAPNVDDDEQSDPRSLDEELLAGTEASSSFNSAGSGSWKYLKKLPFQRAARAHVPQQPGKLNVMEKLRPTMRLRTFFQKGTKESSVVPQPSVKSVEAIGSQLSIVPQSSVKPFPASGGSWASMMSGGSSSRSQWVSCEPFAD